MPLMFATPPTVGISGVSSRSAFRQVQTMLDEATNISWVIGTVADSSSPAWPKWHSDIARALSSEVPDLLLLFDGPLEVCERASLAILAGVKKLVIVSEHVPVHDMIALRHVANERQALVVGPNSTGVLIPGVVKAGYFSRDICAPGRIGVLAKSGSLAYAVLSELRSIGLGTSGVVSTGGDLVKASSFETLIPHFENDPGTDAIVLLGEIGGNDEERVAEVILRSISKPVVAFVSGKSVKPGGSIGHAGAIVRNGIGYYADKVAKLRAAGVSVADELGEVVPRLLEAISANRPSEGMRNKRSI